MIFEPIPREEFFLTNESFFTINIECLPHPRKEREMIQFEKAYRNLHNALVEIAVELGLPGVKSEKDMLNNFERDLMGYGLGNEIKITAKNFPLSAASQGEIFKEAIAKAVIERYPEVRTVIVEVWYESLDRGVYLLVKRKE